jgi:hypothetical protein
VAPLRTGANVPALVMPKTLIKLMNNIRMVITPQGIVVPVALICVINIIMEEMQQDSKSCCIL